MLIGYIGRLAIGRDRQPARSLPAKSDGSQRLQVRQRVRVEGAVHPAVDQKSFLIRGDHDAVRCGGRSVGNLYLARDIRKLDRIGYLARRKIHDLESVVSTILSEYRFGRA